MGAEPTVSPALVDLDALMHWMDARGLGGGPLVGVERLGGGTQNVLLRFARSGRSYVLRRPPEHKRKNSDETMRREARMLAALAGSDVPHPALIAAEGTTDVLGAAFYLMEPIDGFHAPSGLPEPYRSDPALRHRMGLAMVDGIVALGAIDHEAVGLGDFGRPELYLERQVQRWRSQLESYSALPGYGGAEVPGVERVARWLDEHRPATFRPGIIHGDYHLGNVLFSRTDPELAAIVDWELTTIGDPLLDLGWLLATWPERDGAQLGGAMAVEPWSGFPDADELVARYRACSERDCSAIDWYAVLACYKLGIILEGTHARAAAGQAPRATGDMLHAMTVSLFERALRMIAGGAT
ncbi:MAG: phosphotransferase family protein [Deltaproteobacteria bacterium]|nr:phosphotransferase family protein [Deltaproteobacteria bacterium]